VIAVVLLGLLFAIYGAFDRSNVLASGKGSAEQVAEMTALAVEGTLDSTRQLLRAMDFLIRPSTPGVAPDQQVLRARLLQLKADNPFIMDLLVISDEGRIVHWTGDGTAPDIRDRSYYAVHAESADRGLFVGAPLPSRVHADKMFFAMSEALRDEQGRLTYVVAAIVDIVLLHERLGVRMVIPGSTQALVAADGTIYARTPDHERYVGKKVDRPNELGMLSAETPAATILSTSQLDQQQRILSFRRVANYPMVAVGTVRLDQLLAPWRQRLWSVVAIWVVLAAAIAWITRRANVVSHIQHELATIDSLTGVHNRRSILNAALQLQRSSAYAGSLSMLMIDIDHFKSINDRFGHMTGDQALRQVAALLRGHVRATDIVGRYGGEEFLVLMPDTGQDGARRVAEKLCHTVASKVVAPVPLTISIGIATTSETDATLDRTFARADAALYQAKADGRNCVRVAAADGGGQAPGVATATRG